MSDLYSNDAVRERAEQLVNQDVIYCVSHLVSKIAESPDVCRKLDLNFEEDVMPILEMPDWDEPASVFIADMDRDERIDYLNDKGVEFDEDAPGGDLRTLVIETMEAEAGGAQAFCEEHDVEPDRSEVFEHWITSEWLAGKLESKGHPIVRDFLGMTIWGRPTTGQHISMDSVILEIARDLLKA